MFIIIKQLFKKYQLEIIRPNLDYVIQKYQSAIDGYDHKVIQNAQKNESSFSKVKQDLIDFKHSPTKVPRQPVDLSLRRQANIRYN